MEELLPDPLPIVKQLHFDKKISLGKICRRLEMDRVQLNRYMRRTSGGADPNRSCAILFLGLEYRIDVSNTQPYLVLPVSDELPAVVRPNGTVATLDVGSIDLHRRLPPYGTTVLGRPLRGLLGVADGLPVATPQRRDLYQRLGYVGRIFGPLRSLQLSVHDAPCVKPVHSFSKDPRTGIPLEAIAGDPVLSKHIGTIVQALTSYRGGYPPKTLDVLLREFDEESRNAGPEQLHALSLAPTSVGGRSPVDDLVHLTDVVLTSGVKLDCLVLSFQLPDEFGGHGLIERPDELKSLVDQIHSRIKDTHIRLVLKLPFIENDDLLAKILTVTRGKIHGVIAINAMPVKAYAQGPRLPDGSRPKAFPDTTYAGFSGSYVSRYALAMVHRLRQAAEQLHLRPFDIIAAGGVHSIEQVLDYMDAGAVFVLVGTRALTDHLLPAKIQCPLGGPLFSFGINQYPGKDFMRRDYPPPDGPIQWRTFRNMTAAHATIGRDRPWPKANPPDAGFWTHPWTSCKLDSEKRTIDHPGERLEPRPVNKWREILDDHIGARRPS